MIIIICRLHPLSGSVVGGSACILRNLDTRAANHSHQHTLVVYRLDMHPQAPTSRPLCRLVGEGQSSGGLPRRPGKRLQIPRMFIYCLFPLGVNFENVASLPTIYCSIAARLQCVRNQYQTTQSTI